MYRQAENGFNHQTNEYFSDIIPDPEWHQNVWEAVIRRSLMDWGYLVKNYDIISHRELIRFLFFSSPFQTAENICNDYLDNPKLLKTVRQAAIRMAAKSSTELFKLQLINTEDRQCLTCNNYVPFYDHWSFLESAQTFYHYKNRKTQHARKSKRYNFCFACHVPAWIGGEYAHRWQHGSKRKMLERELRQESTVTINILEYITK